jgi:hypothetical protein
MERDTALDLIAQVLSGLEVPMSLSMPLGTAREPWAELHAEAGFGYLNVEDYRKMLDRVLSDG